MNDPLSDLRETLVNVKAEIAATATKYRDIIPQSAKPIFDLLPLAAIGWTQYIPGFNDGDPCVFTISGPYLVPSMFPDERDEDGDWADIIDSWTIKYYTEKEIHLDRLTALGIYPFNYQEAIQVLNDFTKLFEVEEFFEAAFGVGVRVVVHPTGKIDITEYDCGY